MSFSVFREGRCGRWGYGAAVAANGQRHAGTGLGRRARHPGGKTAGTIPTLKMPTARGWDPGQKSIAAPGLKVNAFATGLKHPRWIYVLPNGDVLIAESTQYAQGGHAELL
jgi:glucose/arabinose dehydrogenase